MATELIECTSLSVSYDITGVATVSYTVVHQDDNMVAYDSLSVGGRTFTGYIANAVLSPMPNTDGEWYETAVTLVAIAQ